MNQNPFTSDTFVGKWLYHFCDEKNQFTFDFINKVSFYKHSKLPLYINLGRNLTKGISYELTDSGQSEFKGKVFFIYDVPSYINTSIAHKNRKLKLYKIKQYPGFLINLTNYADLNEFMAGTFKKNSRYKLKKYKKKLETCFDINYKMFYGEISKEEYDFIFKTFKDLLKKRFDEKQVTNNNLEKQEWDFYYEVAYPMILEKKAGLYVIYNGTQPIGVTLNYFSEEILFDAITVFDIDYAKFHLGSVNIMKLVEWCIEQKFKIFDFSKGYFDYKKRWASKEYDFEYHILYDSKSLIPKFIAWLIKKYFETKQFLRDIKVNEKLHKLTFWLGSKSHNKTPCLNYEFFELDMEYRMEDLEKIDCDMSENHFIKSIAFDFLYLNNETYNDLKVCKTTSEPTCFLFFGKTKNVKVVLGKKEL